MSKECLPDHLKDELHTDWPWPFCYIPRSWTSFCGDPPTKIKGNQPLAEVVIDGLSFYYPKPIPQPGEWHTTGADIFFSGYFALTTKSGWHIRFGSRYDDVDFYYTFPSFKIGKV